MAETQDPTSDDPEIARLQEKSKKGAKNIIGDVLADPEVQKVIKNALFKETVKNAIIMSCLLIGLLKLYDVAKILINFNWIGDTTISIILILVGLIYLFHDMSLTNKHGDSETSSSDIDIG
jgi:hypothetical protein